ncbi:MAG TPA: multiheme c-type cytochrome [Planctomycetaceae bacterium]|nr:multiheme c-type cytochrome [Planctomycetaceae bacterium]
MSRVNRNQRKFALSFVFLPLLFILLQGCNSEKPPAPEKSAANTKTPPRMQPLLEGWTEPSFALVLTGEQHGYLEPCGCSETQSGGIARRHDLIKQIRQRGWETVGLDAGGTLKRFGTQSKIKFDAILQALKEMDVRAVNVGPEELMLGAADLYARHLNFAEESDPEKSLTFLSSNLTLFGDPNLGTPVRQKVFAVGGNRVGVTSVVSPELTREVPYLQGDNPEMALSDPIEAVGAALGELEQQNPDLLVLLSHGSLELAEQLAKEYPALRLILSTGGPEDGKRKPIFVGDTMIVQIGHKGKYAGVVGYYPGEQPPLKYELVDLDMYRFKNSPEMIEVMRDYQDRLRDEQVIENDSPIRHPSGYTFVGSKKCGECHTKAYATWSTTKHSHAFESLEKGRAGQEATWVTRIYDPECISCHTTGWNQDNVLRYDSGYLNQQQTPHLVGQQCENCHGPGSHHTDLESRYKMDRKSVEFEQLVQSRREIQLTELNAKSVCIRCHDYENSPQFEFEKYWPKVKHVGRD